MTFAVIPACGHSRRMGRPKLSLPLGGRTVLEYVLNALRLGGVEQILVVVGPHVPELSLIAEANGVHVDRLLEETVDMRATVEAGLTWLEQRFHPRPEDDWLLVPGDHPALDPEVVRQLREARQQHPDRSIFVPTFQRRRGHPTLIGWKHVAGIRSHPEGEGLNTYLRGQGEEVMELVVASAAVLCDLDTPEEYDRLRQKELTTEAQRHREDRREKDER
jgi:molybdenum cofactor cytidylyltransferase